MSAMEEKFERLVSGSFLKPGDVIGVSRALYDHYGIYIGDGKVYSLCGQNQGFWKECQHIRD